MFAPQRKKITGTSFSTQTISIISEISLVGFRFSFSFPQKRGAIRWTKCERASKKIFSPPYFFGGGGGGGGEKIKDFLFSPFLGGRKYKVFYFHSRFFRGEQIKNFFIFTTVFSGGENKKIILSSLFLGERKLKKTFDHRSKHFEITLVSGRYG